MGTINVSTNELLLIEVLRKFSFLSTLGYEEKHPLTGFNPEPSMMYKSSKFKKMISIGIIYNPGLKDFQVWVAIHNLSFTFKKNTFSVNQLIKNKYPEVVIPEVVTDENLGEVLAQFATFIHENLMPIVEGKEWEAEYAGVFQKG